MNGNCGIVRGTETVLVVCEQMVWGRGDSLNKIYRQGNLSYHW